MFGGEEGGSGTPARGDLDRSPIKWRRGKGILSFVDDVAFDTSLPEWRPGGEDAPEDTARGIPVGVRGRGRGISPLLLSSGLPGVINDNTCAEEDPATGVGEDSPDAFDSICVGRALCELAARLLLPAPWLCSASVNGLYLLFGSTAMGIDSDACLGEPGFGGEIALSIDSNVARLVDVAAAGSCAGCADKSAAGRIR